MRDDRERLILAQSADDHKRSDGDSSSRRAKAAALPKMGINEKGPLLIFWERHQLVLFSLTTIIIIVSCITSFSYYRLFYLPHRIQQAYNLVKQGDTEQQVIAIMGKPWKIMITSEYDSWNGAPISKKIGRQKVYYYGDGMDGWTVGFDQSGRAITKNAYPSP